MTDVFPRGAIPPLAGDRYLYAPDGRVVGRILRFHNSEARLEEAILHVSVESDAEVGLRQPGLVHGVLSVGGQSTDCDILVRGTAGG